MPADPFDAPGVDDLYALEPSDFTKARNALAAEVKKSGDRETADAIKKLSKPTVVAWAVNQVVRKHPDKIGSLLELGERAHEAQAAVLKGGDPSALRDATAARRSVVRELAALAAEIAGENHRQDIAATIEAATADDDAGADLRAGRLTHALEPQSGFGLDGMPERAAGKRQPQPDRRELRRLETGVEKTESALTKARDRVERAEARVAEAEEALDRARREAEEAGAEHDTAVAALEAAPS